MRKEAVIFKRDDLDAGRAIRNQVELGALRIGMETPSLRHDNATLRINRARAHAKKGSFLIAV